MALSAAKYRKEHHGEIVTVPAVKTFRNLNVQGWKRRVKDARIEAEKRERAKYLAEQKAAKAKAKKPSAIDRIKAAITKRKVQKSK
jgi:hypothetical protein